MHKQLVANGISGERIMYWKEYFAQNSQEACTIFSAKHLPGEKKKMLVVTNGLYYDGGSMAAVYMAMAFLKKGYQVAIAAPAADDKFIHEFVEQGIRFMIRPALPYVEHDNIGWIDEFDLVIANTLLMIQCACEMSRVKPTIWWLHECSENYEPFYSYTMYQFHKYANERCFDKVRIMAVSSIAKNIFQTYFPQSEVEILPYGIPDEAAGSSLRKKDRLFFAVIGGIMVRKGQDIFIKAAEQLNCSDAEYWIIGNSCKDDFYDKIYAETSHNPSIQLLGGMTREQMNRIYRDIDVVVCSSREETMSIVVTEGMMYGKTCIVSDHAGMAAYVDDGKNGFVFESGNAGALCAKMRWCVENRDKLDAIGQNARKTYEAYFSMEKFGERLEEVVEE
jgi:glycosyltransferase involved in cell wall biosynthesis